MKAKTMIFMTRTVGAGVALRRMIRRRNQEAHKQKAGRPRRPTIADVVGTGIALTKVMRKLHAHKA